MPTTQLPKQVLALALAASFTGCSVLPEAFQTLDAPAVDTETRHWAGSPLTGPADHSPSIDPDAPVVSCTLLYLDHLPETLLTPVLERTRLIASANGTNPISATTKFNFRTQVATGEAATAFIDEVTGFFGLGRITRLGSLFGVRVINLKDMRGIVTPGATTSFTLTSSKAFDVPSLGLIKRRLSVMASRSDPNAAHSIQLSLVFQDILARTKDSQVDGPPPALRTEILVLDISPEVGGTPIVLAAPSPFPGDDTEAFALVLEFKSKASTGSEYADIAATCKEDFASMRAALNFGERDHSANTERLRELQITFEALEFARDHRNTLIHLAASSKASLAEDISLSANDEQLAAFVKRLLTHGGPIIGSSHEQLAWRLESNAFALLADYLDSEELTPVLAGMFARHAGEAARFPGTMRSILDDCSDQSTLQRRLLAENRIFLEDARPSSRVRAFDWLARRNAAPANFDPLASRDTRRKALASLAVEAGR